MKPLFSLIAASLIVTGFSACDGKKEQVRENEHERQADSFEDQAKLAREEAEKRADAIEEADPGFNAPDTKTRAAAEREAGEQKARAFEEQARQHRAQK